jgi:hypothetical protein
MKKIKDKGIIKHLDDICPPGLAITIDEDFKNCPIEKEEFPEGDKSFVINETLGKTLKDYNFDVYCKSDVYIEPGTYKKVMGSWYRLDV